MSAVIQWILSLFTIMGLWQQPMPPVAHAMGSMDGNAYTNSLEAFSRSYDRGFRWFEVDVVQLADDTIIAAHVGNETDYSLPEDSYLWDSHRWQLSHDYTIMDVEQLAVLVNTWPDIHLIIDGKRNEDITIAAHIIADLSTYDRVHPHVFSPGHYEELAWPTTSCVAAAYYGGWGEKGEYLHQSECDYAMTWNSWLEFTDFERDRLWVHTVNDELRKTVLHAKGVSFYTDDFLTEGVDTYEVP